MPRYVFFVFLVLLISSCTSLEKLTLIQNPETTSTGKSTIKSPSTEYVLRPGDLVSIDVKSPDPALVELFNLRSPLNPTGISEQALYLNSFLVNDSGAVNMPEVGLIAVQGLTELEAAEKIKKELGKFLSNVFVMIKVINLQISILGEVTKPGAYIVNTGGMSILKALSLAGDITDYGNRNRVLVIRRQGENVEYGYVDLTKTDSFQNPWYWIRPGDEIYVEPTRLKAVELNISPVRTALLVLTNALVIFRLFN
jgi:polysaccharide export outer membrane protein